MYGNDPHHGKALSDRADDDEGREQHIQHLGDRNGLVPERDVEVDIPDECWFVPVWSVSIRYKVRDFETNEEKPGTYTCLINAFTGEPLWRTEY